MLTTTPNKYKSSSVEKDVLVKTLLPEKRRKLFLQIPSLTGTYSQSSLTDTVSLTRAELYLHSGYFKYLGLFDSIKPYSVNEASSVRNEIENCQSILGALNLNTIPLISLFLSNHSRKLTRNELEKQSGLTKAEVENLVYTLTENNIVDHNAGGYEINKQNEKARKLSSLEQELFFSLLDSA